MSALDGLFGSIRLEVAVDVAAPQPVLWALLADVTTMPQHSPEVVAVRRLGPDGPLAVGARFEGTNRQRADTLPAGLGLGDQEFLTWTRTCVVTWVEPPSGFAYEVVDRFGGITGSWAVHLDEGRSGTRVRQVFRHTASGRSGIRIAADAEPDRAAAIVEQRSRQLLAAMRDTLQSYRRAAEQSVAQENPLE